MKHFNVLFVLLFISISSFGKGGRKSGSDDNTIAIGAKAGGIFYQNFTVKNLTDDPTYRCEVEGGAIEEQGQVGIYGRYKINNLLSIQAELLYAYADVTLSVVDPLGVGTLSYISSEGVDMPLLANIHFGKNFFISAGPQISYRDIYESVGPTFGTWKNFVDATELGIKHNNYDFGAVVGLEYEFDFGLNLGVRSNLSFVNIYKDPANDEKLLIHKHQFFIGYSIFRR